MCGYEEDKRKFLRSHEDEEECKADVEIITSLRGRVAI